VTDVGYADDEPEPQHGRDTTNQRPDSPAERCWARTAGPLRVGLRARAGYGGSLGSPTSPAAKEWAVQTSSSAPVTGFWHLTAAPAAPVSPHFPDLAVSPVRGRHDRAGRRAVGRARHSLDRWTHRRGGRYVVGRRLVHNVACGHPVRDVRVAVAAAGHEVVLGERVPRRRGEIDQWSIAADPPASRRARIQPPKEPSRRRVRPPAQGSERPIRPRNDAFERAELPVRSSLPLDAPCRKGGPSARGAMADLRQHCRLDRGGSGGQPTRRVRCLCPRSRSPPVVRTDRCPSPRRHKEVAC
jgi:hypothetical protein